MKTYNQILEQVREFMTPEMIKKNLRERYGYCDRYLEHIETRFLAEELAGRIHVEEGGYTFSVPQRDASLPDGRSIQPDGTIIEYIFD